MNLWVYRDGKRVESTSQLLESLLHRLDSITSGTPDQRRRRAISALVICGEIEAGLADALGEESGLAGVTDALAEAALGGTFEPDALAITLRGLLAAAIPSTLVLSSPEGFAYYGLHPEAYARAVASYRADEVLVIGIRSIGTTLSAIVARSLALRGMRVRRTTVRPTGPVDDRRLDDLPAITSPVIVVDEGPGLTGSTFLATAEACARAGAKDILLVSSNAPRQTPRWKYLTIVAPAGIRAPVGTTVQTGRPMGRPKVMTSDHRLWKSEGIGLGAERACRRTRALAAEGLVPSLRDEGDGWWSSPWLGQPVDHTRLDGAILDHAARYLARRVDLLMPPESVTDLEPVVTKNAAALGVRPPGPLVHRRAAIVDGQLHPHQWIRVESSWKKTDAATHGDDHFFPGPTDSAWDVAGLIVEWDLAADARARFLEGYRALTGDDVRPRLDAWIQAYAITRAAWSSAMNATDVARYLAFCR